jgi:hypothetical protein
VRSTIHSSVVSTLAASSALLTWRLGKAEPVPAMTDLSVTARLHG